MISRVKGTVVARELDRVEIMTAGGVGYECLIPLSVFESLPAEGEEVSLHTHLAIRDDAWLLFAFGSAYERSVFQKLITAKGVGPALALGILSSLSADRVVNALREKDVHVLMRVPRVGRKKAEQIILDLADKVESLIASDTRQGTSGSSASDIIQGGHPQSTPRTSATQDAVRALLSLGYPQADAERAVRSVLSSGNGDTTGHDVASLVRASLAILTAR